VIPVTENGEIILMRRGFEPRRGHWSLPGGFVDLGETVEVAIARELAEELCVEAVVGALVGVYSHADKGVLVIVFEAALQGTPRPTSEATEVRAFAPDEIPWEELAFSTDGAALRDLLGRA
jgi:ADP-ribose pyrophosphatase YjhB (NUDIX family)